MAAKNLTDKISDVLDTAKTGVELASNIEKCCDPDNKDKSESIVGIVGNGLVLGFKIGSIFTEIINEKDFKLQINSSLSMLRGYVDRSNPFYKNTYNTFYNIGRDRFSQVMYDYGRQVKVEYPNDVKVQAFWSFVSGEGEGLIKETEFNYGVSKLRELDCKMIRNNNRHLDPQYVEQILISTYSSFADDVFRGLKSELRRLGRIV